MCCSRPKLHSRGMHITSRKDRLITLHQAGSPATLLRAGSALAVVTIAALSLALPANAQRPPEPGTGPAASAVVLATPAITGDGLQVGQVGAGLLAGIGIGGAAVAASRTRRTARQPRTT